MIVKADKSHSEVLAKLASMVWENDDIDQLKADFDDFAADPNMVSFLYYYEDIAIGFINSSLRFDYVEGCETSPVGYLEGIYVDPAFRNKGIARKLVEAAESWARSKGCVEFASDTEITNTTSLDFHLKMGFSEANRIVCFKKKI